MTVSTAMHYRCQACGKVLHDDETLHTCSPQMPAHPLADRVAMLEARVAALEAFHVKPAATP